MRLSSFIVPVVFALASAACTAAGGEGQGADGGTASDGGTALPDGATVPTMPMAGSALPAGTFLFRRRVAKDVDHLVARDLVTGAERVVTDLRGDGSKGWSIDGFALSPDRTRIAIASLYGPTAADTATGLATQRVWTLDTEGKSFVRVTPVFPNTSPGTSGFRIDVRDPVFSVDGKRCTIHTDRGPSSRRSRGPGRRQRRVAACRFSSTRPRRAPSRRFPPSTRRRASS